MTLPTHLQAPLVHHSQPFVVCGQDCLYTGSHRLLAVPCWIEGEDFGHVFSSKPWRPQSSDHCNTQIKNPVLADIESNDQEALPSSFKDGTCKSSCSSCKSHP